MRTVALSVGPVEAGKRTVRYYAGTEDDVCARLAKDDPPDASDTCLDLTTPAGQPAPQAAPIDPLSPAFDPLSARAELLGANGITDRLQRVGQRLFQSLDLPAYSDRWRDERVKARQSNAASRKVELCTILDIRDPALQELPWELLRDGAHMLHCQGAWTVSRWARTASAAGAPLPWPLRVLVVIGADPHDVRVKWQDELHHVLKAMCPLRNLIDLEVFECGVPHPNGVKADLHAVLGDMGGPHIVHFIGHGRAQGAQEPAALELWDAIGSTTEYWTAQDIVNWGFAPRLALLNACRTSDAAAQANAIQALNAVGAAFLQAGSAAVIGMQHDIESTAAARFAAGVYKVLTDGGRVDAAVVEGRTRILFPTSDREREWALPTLTASVPLGTVLSMEPRKQGQRPASAGSPPPEIKSFVDRRRERRGLREGRMTRGGRLGAQNRASLMFVVGNAEVGKSSLLKCCLEWHLLQDAEVVYVDFGESPSRNVIDALRHVRGLATTPDTPFRPQLYKRFSRFNHALNALLEKKLPHSKFKTPTVDRELPYDPGSADPNTMERAFHAFTRCLAEIAAERPLVLALDHVSKSQAGIVPDDFKDHVVSRLLSPIRDGSVPGVTAIVAVPPDALATLGLGALSNPDNTCELKAFDCSSWEILLREFGTVLGLERTDVEPLFTFEPIRPRAGWSPARLKTVRDILQMQEPRR